jgi:hypothetical protein
LEIRDGPLANAARTNARLVTDLEPGTLTVAVIGRSTRGAAQSSEVTGSGYRAEAACR